MNGTRILSWLELLVGGLISAAAILIWADTLFYPSESHESTYVSLGSAILLIPGVALIVSGALLGTNARWKWLGQLLIAIPFVVLYCSI